MVAASQTTDEQIFALTAHTWSPQPAPAKWMHGVLEDAVQRNSFLASLRRRMFEQTGTRLLDWIDHFALPVDDAALAELSQVGYETDTSVPKVRAWTHSLGLFPRVRIHVGKSRQVFLKVESVADFLAAQDLRNVTIQGVDLASVRRAASRSRKRHRGVGVGAARFAGLRASPQQSGSGRRDREALGSVSTAAT